MKTASRISRGIVGTIAAVALVATPSFAAAGTAAVQTKQVLPPGSQTCAPLFAKSVTPYIYDGELQSFDIVLSDASYVGLLGVAGDVSIPFNYMTRDIESDGSLRLHVDTTVPVNGTVPVTITLLSALPNAPVCLSTVSFTTDAAGNIETSTPIVPPTTDTGTDGEVVDGGSTGSMGGSTGGSNGGSKGTSHGSTSTGKPNTPVVGSTSSSSTTVGNLVAKMCTKNGAYQLWFILLAIFFVITAFVGLSEPALAIRHGALPAALIGAPLALLLLFWYFATDCRLSYFIPVILLVAAAIGLYSAYRTSPLMAPVVVPPAPKKTTTVTKTEETKTETK